MDKQTCSPNLNYNNLTTLHLASFVYVIFVIVNDSSPLKDLWEDLMIAARVCNLLNKKHNSMERRWRFLGNELGVKKDVLDQFSKEEEMNISPTAVLIHHLGATRPSLTMANLIWALDKIGRDDALSVVEHYFPG